MSGFCGFASNGQDSGARLKRMAAVLATDAPARRVEVVRTGAALAGASHGGTSVLHADDQLLAAVYGQPRLADGVTSAKVHDIIDLYRRREADCVLELRGAYALAVVDRACNPTRVVLATDRLGRVPLYFGIDGDAIVFGTRLDAIVAHFDSQPELSPAGILDYLYFHMVPAPRTIFSGMHRLLPGTVTTIDARSVRESRYWRPEFVEDGRHQFGALREELIALLEGSVRPYTSRDDAGSFLSGGTDSSTVSGMLTRVGGRPARTFSIGFDAPGYDEMGYARIAARHFGTEQHEYYVTPADVVRAMPQVAQFYDQPFGNASALPAYYCARLARETGVRLMLAGDGGDEIFGGNERYATQWVFSLYERLPAAVRRALVEPMLGHLPGGDSVTLVRKARSYVAQANMPLPDRLQSYNLLNRLGAARILDGGLLTQVKADAPLQLLQEAWRGAAAESQVNRMLALDLRFVLADSDLPKVTGMCELAGVDVVYPLLDDALVDFSLRLAPELKLHRKTLRPFFKEALRGFLPSEIIAKRKHGFGLPFGVWLREDPGLRDLVGDTLSAARGRGIVRREFIDELLDARMAQHAAYYGTMAWVIAMLELWLQKTQAGCAARSAATDSFSQVA